MQRKPSGPSADALNWCHVAGGTVTRSNVPTECTSDADQDVAATAENHHRVRVLVAFERRVSGGATSK